MLVTFYGLGTILGAGIYVLIGKVAAQAGIYTPLAFLLASLIAFFTAVSYAELSSRYPLSAGEAAYVEEAFQKKWLSQLIGWLVVLTGVVSAAAITQGFVGYLQVFVTLPQWLAVFLLLFCMGAVAVLGITESAVMVMIITLIELLGLLLILFYAADSFQKLPVLWQEKPPFMLKDWAGVISGAFIAFYAYIGFEDMVNIAEEIKNPEKTLPAAIFLALALASFLYIIVALAMILVLPMSLLSTTDAPLAAFITQKGYSPFLISLISMVAIVNGAFAQIIMASRVIYGMAKKQKTLAFFASVNPKTQTPIWATAFVVFIILFLALGFNIEVLAKATSSIILCVFAVINLALIVIKVKGIDAGAGKNYSLLFPMVGFLITLVFLFSQLWF
ncbi:amino acid transporter [Legionella londiniensis]|uniref:Amino acid transporter n=2 Tax=Legionella londiniensis TaxID=45068 RepID=A0A0W0VT24_9GAMM|nr:amino acid permease [Legionella londiniensis]KTD23249.1 amino acid transporter [Legionella londiniensis]STX93739.1 amino acid transporter [Legionella londiniensis]